MKRKAFQSAIVIAIWCIYAESIDDVVLEVRTFRLAVMLASIVTVFRCIPTKVIDVDGPSSFDDLTGALICSQR